MGKTSSAVKARYNAKVYDRIAFYAPKELSAAFRARCAELGVPQAQVLKAAVKAFVEGSNGSRSEKG